MRRVQEGFGVFAIRGMLCEVNLEAVPQHVEGSGQLATYPCCLVDYDMGGNVLVYMLHDHNMTVFSVSSSQVAKPTLPMPNVTFESGEKVEIQYRVSPTDEYGWWGAKMIGWQPDARVYIIEWPNGIHERVTKNRVRKAAFK